MTIDNSKDPARTAMMPVWNPDAAACWCLLFTPLFGAILITLNWKTLGCHEQARKASKWIWISASLLLFAAITFPFPVLDGPVRLSFLVCLLAWFFRSVPAQRKYLEKTFGKNYPKKPWKKPLLIAFGAFILQCSLYFLYAIILPQPA